LSVAVIIYITSKELTWATERQAAAAAGAGAGGGDAGDAMNAGQSVPARRLVVGHC